MSSEAILNALVIGQLLGGIIFAVVFGGRCERIGAAICFGSAVLSLASQVFGLALANEAYPVLTFLVIDLGTSVAFGVLAWKHPDKLWPGVAGVAQFLVFTFSASRLVNFPLDDVLLAHAINLSSFAVKLTLVAGTWQARWGKPKVDEWDEFAATLAALPPVAPPART